MKIWKNTQFFHALWCGEKMNRFLFELNHHQAFIKFVIFRRNEQNQRQEAFIKTWTASKFKRFKNWTHTFCLPFFFSLNAVPSAIWILEAVSIPTCHLNSIISEMATIYSISRPMASAYFVPSLQEWPTIDYILLCQYKFAPNLLFYLAADLPV